MSSRLKGLNLATGLRHQYQAHCGAKAQLRNLRHKCGPVLKPTDSQSVAARLRVFVATENEPNPEYGRLQLLSAAMDAAAETGETWITCIHYFMDKFEEKREQAS